MAPRILLIEAVDYRGFPLGGQLTFAKNMVKAFGGRLALVGISTDDTPVGKWIDKEFDSVKVPFFSFGRRRAASGRPLIPARLSAFLDLRKHRKAILGLGIKRAMMLAPETILSTVSWGWDRLCYVYASADNPLTISRYPGAAVFAKVFEGMTFRAVSCADLILAHADNSAIEALCARSRGKLPRDRIVQYPTRVDTEIFHLSPKEAARKALSLDEKAAVVVTTGRIHWAKGYALLLDAFKLFLDRHPGSLLYFVGDGESRADLQKRINGAGLSAHAFITGNESPQKVAAYLNAADLFTLASYKEGWSTSMVEALCCGKPIVSTDVSSAREIVATGENGYVLADRDPHEFAAAMEKALGFGDLTAFATQGSQRYGLKFLERDLSALWEPLRR